MREQQPLIVLVDGLPVVGTLDAVLFAQAQQQQPAQWGPVYKMTHLRIRSLDDRLGAKAMMPARRELSDGDLRVDTGTFPVLCRYWASFSRGKAPAGSSLSAFATIAMDAVLVSSSEDPLLDEFA